MDTIRESLLLLITTPIYIVLIGLEILLSYIHDKHYYTVKGTLTNIYLSVLNFSLDILLRVFSLAVLEYFFQFHTLEISHAILYWVVLLIAQDFMFYILHYVDHYVRFFWAVHVTHHSSEEFNLTVGFRSSVFQPVYRFIYFIPLVFLGFRPVDILFMYAATQIYGIIIHTKSVGKLGPLEWIFATPSHHRVHHASNARYLDKNMGMVFIFWDRLFGTFEEEKEEVKFGLTQNINTHHPVKVVFHEWQSIIQDVMKPIGWKARFMYVFGPPGWSHDRSRKTSRELRRELNEQA